MQQLPPFHSRVYDLARTIPAVATLSYGEVAARLGARGASRAGGQALGRNPFAIVVPCHRVLAAGGKMGGFSANGGVSTRSVCPSSEASKRDRSWRCSRIHRGGASTRRGGIEFSASPRLRGGNRSRLPAHALAVRL